MSVDELWTTSYVESQILPLTKRLSDKTYEIIFSRNESRDNKFFLYNCHLCSVSNIVGEQNLKRHISSQKHQNRIEIDYVPNADAFRAQIFIHTRVCTVLTNSEKALIGVEHVIEIHDPNLKEPFFICSICDKHFDPPVIVSHMISQKHQRNYLELHFKKLVKVLHDNDFFRKVVTYRQVILTAITKKIENYFGRMKPTIYDNEEYKSNKTVINEIMKTRKYCKPLEIEFFEKFLIEFCKDELQKITDDDEKKNNDDAETESSNQQNLSFFQSKILFSEIDDITIKNDSNLEAELKFRESYNFERFRIAQEKVVAKIEENYKNYAKKPSTHPSFEIEWRIFWLKKYNLLLSNGEDASAYDYKPEWTQCWSKRVNELKREEITEKLKDISEKLNITPDEMNQFYEVIEKENVIKEAERKEQEAKQAAEEAKRKASPFQTPGRISCYSVRRCRSPSDYSPDRIYSSDDDDRRNLSVNIVIVCRHLIDIVAHYYIDEVKNLLDNAIQMEQKEPNSSEILMNNEKVVNLLQRINTDLSKELAKNEIAKSHLVRIKKAVECLDILLKEFNKPKSNYRKFFDPAMQVAKQAKFSISKALAQIVIEKNYVHVTPEELNEIVNDLLTKQLEEEDRELKEELLMIDGEINILTDDDMKNLLRNFSKLSEEDQNKMMKYIYRLYEIDAPRVKKLIKYVDIGDEEVDDETNDVEMKNESMEVE